MGSYEPVQWRPAVVGGVPRAQRQRGQYWAYVPEPLSAQTPVALPPPVIERVAEATAALTAASRSAGDVDLDSFTSLTLRSESVASSVIEGVQASARNVALADFTGHGGPAALEVARNARIMRRATQEMATSARVTVDDLVVLQGQLVPALPGLRQEQVWIGGVNPMVATFVPPTAERVPALLDDLMAYLDDPADAPVVAAAVVHAQFETVHPFRDGNGRIGRALTHTVLARAGATATVIPFSRILAARKDAYIDGLVAWRTHDGLDDRVAWIELFADALVQAAALAEDMAKRLRALQHDYRERLTRRRQEGVGRQPRQGSAVLSLLQDVVAHPVDTAASAARRLGVSSVAARTALDELTLAGVYRESKIDKGKTVSYVANGILELADTVLAGSPEPSGGYTVAPRRERLERVPVCGYPLPRETGWCTEPPGHTGPHRRSAAAQP